MQQIHGVAMLKDADLLQINSPQAASKARVPYV
jgi:hypothetical protein